MDRELLLQFIQNHIPATPQKMELIAGSFTETSFAKNEYLLKAGKVNNDYLFLAQGLMRAFTLDAEGNEVTTFFYPKNRVVFEVSSFYLRSVSTENIQAVCDCTGYSITFDKLNTLFHSIPEFREFGRAMLVKEFVAFKERTLSFINRSAEERYADLISTNREILQYAQLKHIASYLGMTDTSLSRIRREFSKK